MTTEMLEILTHPHPNLRVKAKPVEAITAQTGHFIDSMLFAMYRDNGIGLAATQVNSQDRIIVLDVSENGTDPLVMINPKIIKHSGSCDMTEGCLSFPGVFLEITRPERIVVEALDKNGKEFTLEANGLKGRCILHEVDHLEGIVLVDRVSRLKRERALKKYFQGIKEKQKG